MSKQFSRMLNWLGILLMVALLLLIPLQTPVPAQSVTGLSARLSRLEADSTNLRSRVSQLESQLSRRGGATTGRPPAQTPVPGQEGPARGTLSSDPMFDRLATLAIEQKERMDQLEARLAALEARLSR